VLTTELIEFLSKNPVTDDQGYNLIIGDIYECVTEKEIAEPAAQKLVGYFMYKIQSVLLPVIRNLQSGR
jgi:hypothetical protein